MPCYRFNDTVYIDDCYGARILIRAGQVVDAREILPGCLQSCLNTRVATPAPDDAPQLFSGLEIEEQTSVPFILGDDLDPPTPASDEPEAKKPAKKSAKKSAKKDEPGDDLA